MTRVEIALRGGGARRSIPPSFENEKEILDFREKCPNSGHRRVKFFIENAEYLSKMFVEVPLLQETSTALKNS